jgi:hypothetical protein
MICDKYRGKNTGPQYFEDKKALKFGREVWVLKKWDEQRLEAAQMKFLRHLLGITKFDKEMNQICLAYSLNFWHRNLAFKF